MLKAIIPQKQQTPKVIPTMAWNNSTLSLVKIKLYKCLVPYIEKYTDQADNPSKGKSKILDNITIIIDRIPPTAIPNLEALAFICNSLSSNCPSFSFLLAG